MEQSTLQEILSVEKAIREELDAERQQASQWLENARRDIEQQHLAELESIRRDAARNELEARDFARAGAAEAAARSAQHLEAAGARTDDELRRRVRECLAALVPEAASAR